MPLLLGSLTDHVGVMNPDLSRLPSTTNAAHAQRSQSFSNDDHAAAQGTPSGGSTSLPSFASFQEHAARNEDGDLIIAPMSQRLSCSMCTKLKPLVREIALAVSDVDESVQSLGTRSISRVSGPLSVLTPKRKP